MGASASVAAVESASSSDVASAVSGFGSAFGEYAETLTANGIDGATALTLEESDLDDLGISKLHKKRLMAEIAKLKAIPAKPEALSPQEQSKIPTPDESAETSLPPYKLDTEEERNQCAKNYKPKAAPVKVLGSAFGTKVGAFDKWLSDRIGDKDIATANFRKSLESKSHANLLQVGNEIRKLFYLHSQSSDPISPTKAAPVTFTGEEMQAGWMFIWISVVFATTRLYVFGTLCNNGSNCKNIARGEGHPFALNTDNVRKPQCCGCNRQCQRSSQNCRLELAFILMYLTFDHKNKGSYKWTNVMDDELTSFFASVKELFGGAPKLAVLSQRANETAEEYWQRMRTSIHDEDAKFTDEEQDAQIEELRRVCEGCDLLNEDGSLKVEEEKEVKELLVGLKKIMNWNNLGLALKNLKSDYKGAEAAYRKHIAEDPNYALAHFNLGNLLQNQFQDYDGAKASYGLAIKADPNCAIAHYNLALLLKTQFQDYEGAKASYGLAIKADPNYAMAHCALGALLETQFQDYEGAKASYGLAIKADPNYALAHSNLGSLLQIQFQDYEGAKASYGLAIKADPNHADAHHNYSVLLATHLNDPDLAVTHNKRAAALGHADAQKFVGWFAKKAAEANAGK